MKQRGAAGIYPEIDVFALFFLLCVTGSRHQQQGEHTNGDYDYYFHYAPFYFRFVLEHQRQVA
ncbi:MAG: hypothetical protein HQL99_07475 [Magnetococcales bacterium]|nr:hypothetical protein [Magnetococcales bacterium]